jgi:predicted transcriptional regulator YdeE
MPRIGELAAIQVGVDTYGVGRMPADAAPGEFEYLAGVEVSSFEQLPEGMVGWEIPPNRYAVLPATHSELARGRSLYGQCCRLGLPPPATIT